MASKEALLRNNCGFLVWGPSFWVRSESSDHNNLQMPACAFASGRVTNVFKFKVDLMRKFMPVHKCSRLLQVNFLSRTSLKIGEHHSNFHDFTCSSNLKWN